MSDNKTVQVTRPVADKSNNMHGAYEQKNKIDWKGLATFSATLSVVIFIPWSIFLIAAGVINLFSPYGFNYVPYIFVSGPIIWLVMMIVGILMMFPIIGQTVINMAYLSFSGTRVHRDDLRVNADKALAIGLAYGESAASTGIDTMTYAPQTHNTATSKTDVNGTGGNTSPHTKPDNEIDVLAWIAMSEGK